MKAATETRNRLQAAVASKSTEMLLTVARLMNLQTEAESILVSEFVANELERRLPESEFLALMAELEAELSAA